MIQKNNSILNLAPIVLFVYNRPVYTRQTVEALRKNELANESELFIYSDAPKNENALEKVLEVRNYIKSIDGFKKITIIEREKNWGLANSIIDGVTKIVNEYGKIIVLEDDLVTSPYFLKFMNEALEMYKDESKVGSIHGHIYDLKHEFPQTFFIPKIGCWGWATWSKAWALFESDGRKLVEEILTKELVYQFNNNGSYDQFAELNRQANGDSTAWASRFNASLFLHNKLTLYPGRSFVKHIGLYGEHFSGFKQNNPKNGVIYPYDGFELEAIKVNVDTESYQVIIDYYRSLRVSLFRRIVNKFCRGVVRCLKSI